MEFLGSNLELPGYVSVSCFPVCRQGGGVYRSGIAYISGVGDCYSMKV